MRNGRTEEAIAIFQLEVREYPGGRILTTVSRTRTGPLRRARDPASPAVDVTLLEEPGGTPIAGAMVMLVDSTGGAADRELAGALGRASLRAPRPGTWRLVAERIGYGTIASVPFELGEGEALPVTLRAPIEPIELDALEVRTDAACRADRAGARPAAVVWEEARKALERVVWTRAREGYRFEVALHDRRLDVRGRVRQEESREVEVTGIRPFATLPPEILVDQGFIRVQDGDTLYFGPDAEVLLSEAFARTHCFHTTLDEAGERVGLGFEPLDLGASDIAGTLWLDGGGSGSRWRPGGCSGRGPTRGERPASPGLRRLP